MKFLVIVVVCLFGLVAAIEPTTYCVNLAKDVERRAHMEESFRAASLENINWVGVDGAEADLSLYSFLTEDIKQKLLTSEIGAMISHIDVWKQIAASGAEMSLVFEDDIVLPANFKSELKKVSSELPEDWNMMYLSYLKAWEFKRPVKYSEHLVQPNWPLGFYAYALSAAGAQALLDQVEAGSITLPQECVDCGIDAVVASWINEKKASAFAANPELCYNSFAFSSTIGARDAKLPRDMLEALQSATPTPVPSPPSPSPPSPSPPSPSPASFSFGSGSLSGSPSISASSSVYPMIAAALVAVVAFVM